MYKAFSISLLVYSSLAGIEQYFLCYDSIVFVTDIVSLVQPYRCTLNIIHLSTYVWNKVYDELLHVGSFSCNNQ